MKFHHRKLTENQLIDSSHELDKLRTRITTITNNNPDYAKQLEDASTHLQAAQQIIVDVGIEHDIYLNES